MSNETTTAQTFFGIALALLFAATGVGVVLFLEDRELDWTLKFLGLLCVGGPVVLLLAARFERYSRYVPFLLVVLISQTGFAYEFHPGYQTSANEVFSIMVLVIWGMNRFARGEKLFPRTYFFKPLLLFYAIGLFGVLTASQLFAVTKINILIVAKSYLIYPLYLLVIPDCVKTEKDLVRICWSMLLFSLIPLGYAASGAMALNDVMQERLSVTLWGALNIFVGYIIPIALLALGLAIDRKSWAWMLVLPFFLVMSYTLLLSQTRSGWAAGIVAGALFMVLSRKKLIFTALFVVLSVGVIISPLGTTIEVIVHERIVEQTVTADSSLEKRYARWQIAWETAKAHPLTGSGWGGCLLPIGDGVSDNSTGTLPTWHNAYLEILSQLGFPGLLAFLWIWWRILGREANWLRSQLDLKGLGAHIGLWAAVFSCLIYAIGEQQFYRLETASHTYFLAAMLIAAGEIRRRKQLDFQQKHIPVRKQIRFHAE